MLRLAHRGGHALGTQSYLHDLRTNVDITTKSDSNAAKAFASRQDLGKQRHTQTKFLWIQHQVAVGAIIHIKIKNDHNVSEILTKVMPNATIIKHMTTMGYRDETNLSKLHNNLQSG